MISAMNESTLKIWTADELRAIVDADDLHVAPFRGDGGTHGTPTWIWCVAVNGDLYARAYHGTQSRWFQAGLRQKAGRITAAGLVRDVSFVPETGSLIGAIDEAYRQKYDGSPYLAAMVGLRTRAASVRINPA